MAFPCSVLHEMLWQMCITVIKYSLQHVNSQCQSPSFYWIMLLHRIRNFPSSKFVVIFNRSGVAGAVLQTAVLLTNWVSQWGIHPFPPDLQNIIIPKPLEIGSWNFVRIVIPHHVSPVTFHLSPVVPKIWKIAFFASFTFQNQNFARTSVRVF